MPSRLVIVQHEHGGHRLIYVRHLLRSPGAGDQPAVVLTRQAVESWEFRQHLEPYLAETKVELRLVDDGAACEDSLRAGLALAAESDGLLVLPDADLMLRALAQADASIRARVEVRYLVMRTPMGSARDRMVAASKYGLAALIAWRWKRSRGFFLTDTFGVVKRLPLAPLLAPLPDPSPALPSSDRESARRALKLPHDVFIYGILGTVTEGKNPDVALEALRHLSSNDRLLLAGQMSDAVREVVAAADPLIRERVITLDRHLSDEELAWAVSACDVVLLLHNFDGPSGMLLNAAAAGVPVIVGQSPWLRRVVARRELGAYAQHRPEYVAAVIQELQQWPVVVKALPTGDEEEFARRLLGR